MTEHRPVSDVTYRASTEEIREWRRILAEVLEETNRIITDLGIVVPKIRDAVRTAKDPC